MIGPTSSEKPDGKEIRRLYICLAAVVAFFLFFGYVIVPVLAKPAEDRKALCESKQGMIVRTHNDRAVCVKGLTKVDLRD